MVNFVHVQSHKYSHTHTHTHTHPPFAPPAHSQLPPDPSREGVPCHPHVQVLLCHSLEEAQESIGHRAQGAGRLLPPTWRTVSMKIKFDIFSLTIINFGGGE